jgi:hypothetical protein
MDWGRARKQPGFAVGVAELRDVEEERVVEPRLDRA